jgi:hypothetical protein
MEVCVPVHRLVGREKTQRNGHDDQRRYCLCRPRKPRLKVGSSTKQSAVQNNSGHLRCDAVAMDKYEIVTKALKDCGLSLTQERCHVPADLLTIF